MKRTVIFALVAIALVFAVYHVSGLSRSLPEPEIFFAKGYDTNRIEQIHKALRTDKVKYLGGLVSYWVPKWSTTLVYEGDAQTLTAFLATLTAIEGINVRLTFSPDLAKETGSALSAGSWWVEYSHTAPDTLTVRINLASESLGGDKFELLLPKPSSPRGQKP